MSPEPHWLPAAVVARVRKGNQRECPIAGESYIHSLCTFGPVFKKMPKPDGSIVIEMGTLALCKRHEIEPRS